MKKLLFVFLFVLNGFMSFAQIQNGSFELGAPASWISQFFPPYVLNWSTPTGGSSDILPMQSPPGIGTWNNPPAYDGNRLAFMILEENGIDYKEYTTNTLSAPLTAGTIYNITIYVRNNGNISNLGYTTTPPVIPANYRGFFGIMFSNTFPNPVVANSYASYPNNYGVGRCLAPATHPVYTTVNTWVPVTFSYTAVGGEMYMTIGQFRPGTATSRHGFFVDMLEIVVGLPIELIYFNAEANESDRTVSVTWQTQSEINNDYFEVQHSTDFQNWTSVEQVDGAGNSENILNYTARDLDPLTGISYYRLKQVDEDGKVSYSDVRSVKLGIDLGDELLTVFPNPATTEFTVYGERLFPEDFSLFNSLGENVPLVVKASNEEMIVYSIEGMEKGIYFLNYNTGMEIIHKKVFIEK